MSAPCSAYCRPEEGVHVGLAYGETGTTLADNRRFIGLTYIAKSFTGVYCQAGELVELLDIQPAHEAPESPIPGFTVPLLVAHRLVLA